jgi:hypothetical protein
MSNTQISLPSGPSSLGTMRPVSRRLGGSGSVRERLTFALVDQLRYPALRQLVAVVEPNKRL